MNVFCVLCDPKQDILIKKVSAIYKKKRGSLYLSLVPLFKASRIASPSRTSNAEAHAEYAYTPSVCIRADERIQQGLYEYISQWASIVALSFDRDSSLRDFEESKEQSA